MNAPESERCYDRMTLPTNEGGKSAIERKDACDVGGSTDTFRMDERLPKIDEVISTVFGEAFDLSTGVKRRRTLQVEYDMRTFLETETDRFLLTDDERTLLAAEQEFEPNGAACRTLEAEVLFVALPGFIAPPHLAPDLLLRRVQLDLVDALIGYVAYEVLRGYDSSSIRMELRRALVRARHQLKRERAEQSWAREVARMTPAQREAIEHAERGIEKHLAARRASATEQPAADAADSSHDGRTE